MFIEPNCMEYKRQITNDLEKKATSFLNYHERSVLHVGIDRQGTLARRKVIEV